MLDTARLAPFGGDYDDQRSPLLGQTGDTSDTPVGHSEIVLPRSGPSSVPRLLARLQLIPALLAITWIVVAAIRFD